MVETLLAYFNYYFFRL